MSNAQAKPKGKNDKGKIHDIRDRLQRRAQASNKKELQCNSQETFAMYDLAVVLDQAVVRLRRHMGITIDSNEAMANLNEIGTALCVLEAKINTAATLTGLKWYKRPKGLQRIGAGLSLPGFVEKRADTPEQMDPAGGAPEPGPNKAPTDPNLVGRN